MILIGDVFPTSKGDNEREVQEREREMLQVHTKIPNFVRVSKFSHSTIRFGTYICLHMPTYA